MRRFAAIGLLLVAGIASSPPVPASHADGVYDQPVWFQWETRILDTIIIPADHGPIFNGNGALGGGDPVAEAHPCTNSYTRAMVQSALDWKIAINTYGPAWLKAVTINHYVLGCGPTPPQSALQDPEIIVAADENKATLLGVSMDSRPCISLTSKMFIQSFTYNDMYTVSGHEFGHCMGLNHVTDEHPDEDILDATMDESIGSATNPRRCPSNLNVNTLKGVFATAMFQSGGGVDGTVAISSYAQIPC